MQAFYVDSVDSTNDLARSMLSEGRIRDAAFIVAREQTAGRGTRGRTWTSPRDAGIYLTVIDRPAIRAGEELRDFTRAAGIACAEVLTERTSVPVRLKPVNDLTVDERKLGGILTEAVIEQHRLCALITGVGINVARFDRAIPKDLVQPICLEEAMSPFDFSSLDVRALTLALVERTRHWNAIVAEPVLDLLEEQWRQYCIDAPAAAHAGQPRSHAH